jgi:2-keto-4-pentenoate hydratase/2-oxohepta-3-ene-1,7-dioic acid hydratase in catechol pathway
MIIRYKYENNIAYGFLKSGRISKIIGDIFSEYEITNDEILLDDVKLLAPVQPSKVVCVGLNYVDHAMEVNLEIPKAPLLFIKPSTTVIGPEDVVVYPPETGKLEYEAELAIIIKKETYQVSEENVHEHILGYTCANDVTARDIQFGDGQWTRGKSFNTFCPLGPGIVSDINPEKLDIQLTLNGELKQASNTDKLIFSVPYLVHYISQVMTLLPGDVIITGTPHGIGPMNIGDTVSVKIEGIGELKNSIVASKTILNPIS